MTTIAAAPRERPRMFLGRAAFVGLAALEPWLPGQRIFGSVLVLAGLWRMVQGLAT